jgi:hypothetical protein
MTRSSNLVTDKYPKTIDAIDVIVRAMNGVAQINAQPAATSPIRRKARRQQATHGGTKRKKSSPTTLPALRKSITSPTRARKLLSRK